MPRLASVPEGSATDPCCCFSSCVDAYGTDLEVTVSGVVSCGCYNTGGNDLQYTILADVNGVFTATWDGGTLNWKNANVGTIRLTTYTSVDGTCVGVDTTSDTTVDLTVHCEVATGLFSISLGFVFDSDFAPFDSTFPNILTCAGGGVGIGDGQATLAVP